MYRKLGVIFLTVLASQVQAKVDSSQAARLGQDLTPLGAERAGNAEGSIPPGRVVCVPQPVISRACTIPIPFPATSRCFA